MSQSDWLDVLDGKVAAAERAAGPSRVDHLEFALAMQGEASRLIKIAKVARAYMVECDKPFPGPEGFKAMDAAYESLREALA